MPKLIRAWRRELGLSQRQLGARVGVRSNVVNYWENGSRRPAPRHLQQLATVFGTQPHEILLHAGKVPVDEREGLVVRTAPDHGAPDVWSALDGMP